MAVGVEAAPAEYRAAVERFLEEGGLSVASRRIYRIALTSWAWTLAGRRIPVGDARRGAKAPRNLPLAALDDRKTPRRLQRAFTQRAEIAGARTANRELAMLRSAISWWRSRGWIEADPASGIKRVKPSPPQARLTEDQVRKVLSLDAPPRDKALWHLVHDTGGAIERMADLNVEHLDLAGLRTNDDTPGEELHWTPDTAKVLATLIGDRKRGPLFLTGRRATAGTPEPDVCPETGQGRLSYRRMAEVFRQATAEIDPTGEGWTLRQLQPREER
jgi:integrase/recombinase XerD